MLEIGKFLSKEQRFRLIKFRSIRRFIIWKNRKVHFSPAYSLIMFSRMFDIDWYLEQYPDVAVAKMDPIQHYIQHGAQEKRSPNSWFNGKQYSELQQLQDNENPFLHFLIHQRKIEKSDTYKQWRETYFPWDANRVNSIQGKISKMKVKPLISVVIPVYNPDVYFLKRAVDSIKDQLYTSWEICIADDASTNSEVKDFLKDLEKEGQIKVVYRKVNGHISEATNSAIESATGDYIAFMDQDDEIRKDALFEIAQAINADPQLALIYSDEDKIDAEGERFYPHFKSDWNRMLLYSQNYINHLTVVKASFCRAVGGLRKGLEGSQDYDFLLRIIEKIEDRQIYHIPKILYHWRAIEGSTAANIDNKSYAVKAGKRALEEHVRRSFPEASVELACSAFYKVNFPLPEEPKTVSIIIPFRDQVELLKNCLHGIFENTSYKSYEVLLVDNNSSEEATLEYLHEVEKVNGVKILKYDSDFNYSAINNFTVSKAKGEIILLMNNDVEVISENWLTEMLSYFALEDTAVVGAKLLYPDDRIQHAGIVLGIGGVAGHPHKFLPASAMGYMSKAQLVQNVSAVTGACMAVRKSVYEEVGGLDEKLKVAFNDVDFCIKVREAGYKLVFTPFAQLYHHESKSRGSDMDPDKIQRFQSEIDYMQKKWRGVLYSDPYYNPNLTLEKENFELAFPPASVYGDMRKV